MATTATDTGFTAVLDRSFSFGRGQTRHEPVYYDEIHLNHTKLMEDNAEPVVVVAVVGGVVVPIGNATVLGVVVPATTAEHAVRARGSCLKHRVRKPLVYPFSAYASNGVICS